MIFINCINTREIKCDSLRSGSRQRQQKTFTNVKKVTPENHKIMENQGNGVLPIIQLFI